MTSANTTRRATSASRRAALYGRRLAAAAVGSRERLNALVGWWMSEWHRLPEARRAEEFERLRLIAAGLNKEARQ